MLSTLSALEARVGALRGALLPSVLLETEQSTGAPAADDGAADPRALAYLTVLDEYSVAMTREGRYVEAGAACSEVRRMREAEAARAGAALAAAQAARVQELAEAQARQFEAFTSAWQEFLTAYDVASVDYLAGAHERQAEALRVFQNQAATEVSARAFRPSRELLGWTQRADSLVRMRKYSGALRVRAAAAVLERRERAAFDEERLNSFALREVAFVRDQDAERAALAEKMDMRRMEHAKRAEEDARRLAQRNTNAIAQARAKHARELSKAAAGVRIQLATTRASRL